MRKVSSISKKTAFIFLALFFYSKIHCSPFLNNLFYYNTESNFRPVALNDAEKHRQRLGSDHQLVISIRY